MTMPDVLISQKTQLSNWYSHGSCSSSVPKSRTQLRQMQCPHGRRYRGVLRKQTRQVLSNWNAFQSWCSSRKNFWWRSAAILVGRELSVTKSSEKLSSIILTDPEGKTKIAGSCKCTPSLHARRQASLYSNRKTSRGRKTAFSLDQSPFWH